MTAIVLSDLISQTRLEILKDRGINVEIQLENKEKLEERSKLLDE